MSTAPRYVPHSTVADHATWEGDWKLLAGVPVAMTPSPFGRHAKLLARMVALLQGAVDAAGCAATVLVEIDWIVSRDTVLRPDVIVVCGPEPARHVERTPPLVVEILSETTRERDLDFKLELYREQGVAWYLVVDPEAGHIRGLSLTADRRYVDRFAVGDPEPLTIDICDGCELSLDVTRLFA
jgi:Uma2 family endonuclease